MLGKGGEAFSLNASRIAVGPSSGALNAMFPLSFLLYAYFHSFLCGGSQNAVIMLNPAQKDPSE